MPERRLVTGPEPWCAPRLLSLRRPDFSALDEDESDYFEEIQRRRGTQLAPSLGWPVTHFTRYLLASPSDAALRADISCLGSVHAEILSARRRQLDRVTVGSACETVIIELPGLEREPGSLENLLAGPHRSLEQRYVAAGLRFEKTWRGQRETSTQHDSPLVPPLTFLSIQSSTAWSRDDDAGFDDLGSTCNEALSRMTEIVLATDVPLVRQHAAVLETWRVLREERAHEQSALQHGTS
ncbi:MAG: hypothetical protein AAF533_07695 [Acidobacteriota bacterium]